MPLNLASPGIVVREVDLTVGRVNPVSAAVGAIVGPFEKGPVNQPTVVQNENDLLTIFGEPKSVGKQYEYWLTASSFLAYGGSLRVVRADDQDLKNSFVGSGTSIKITSDENYIQLGYDENAINNFTVVSRNPGSWGNSLRVCLIDAKADQILTGITTDNIAVGYGITQSVDGNIDGSTKTTLSGYVKGIITDIVGPSQCAVKLISFVDNATSTETPKEYQIGSPYNFNTTNQVQVFDSAANSITQNSITSQTDWYNLQNITLGNKSTISWKSIANRPSTSAYAKARGTTNDEVHVVVIDDDGSVSGNAGTILEKFLNLSKAKDAEFSVGNPSYWRKYIFNNSKYIFGGSTPSSTVSTSFDGTGVGFTPKNNSWDSATSTNLSFNACGTQNYLLSGGKNYDGLSNLSQQSSLSASVGSIQSGYGLFENKDNYKVDFILMGSANYEKVDAQAIAYSVIGVAESRKDSLAFISPYRKAFLNDSINGSVSIYDDQTITDNVIDFFGPLTSSTYAVFDSGYKYMYDRFNNTFRYVPLNGDIAGTCARNDINQFPWFSPAGTSRGAILNAVKLAYNPNKLQRDSLYSNRINPVIFSPGSGIILFGDKTAYAKSSAFDRINVRRLFIYLENAISAAAKDQLFEFNDEITRTNFVNIIEPFLRDVQSKRGIFDYVVVCDQSNNTAAIIDNNEFVADIYIKPARSINFIGLTFVATRTGVSFEEVIGKI